MSNLTVHWGNKTRILSILDSQNLLELLAGAGIAFYAPCKGNGSCHKCRVTFRSQGRTENVGFLYGFIFQCKIRHLGGGAMPPTYKAAIPSRAAGLRCILSIRFFIFSSTCNSQTTLVYCER